MDTVPISKTECIRYLKGEFGIHIYHIISQIVMSKGSVTMSHRLAQSIGSETKLVVAFAHVSHLGYASAHPNTTFSKIIS